MKPMIRNKNGGRALGTGPIRANSMNRIGMLEEKNPIEKPKFNNLAENFLKRDEQKAEDEENSNRLKMKMINDEMRDMLMMARNTEGAIKDMNEAFAGDAEFEYIQQKMKNGKNKVKKVAR